MLHVLVGDSSGDPRLLLDAAKSGRLREWVVPKNAFAGDTAVFFIRPEGFLAKGIIHARPNPHPRWPRRYRASVHSISIFPSSVPPAFVSDNMPDWGWPRARTLSYTSVTSTTEKMLLSLLDDYQAPFTASQAEATEPLTEGMASSVLVTAYERNPIARQRCIQHYGPACSVCGFSFEDVYGERAVGYIHVHHIKAVSTRGGVYEVDPVRDLRPVCPNCHAVIHLKRPPFSIATVKGMRKAAKANGS